ncbi:MAG: DUF3284 domain-containing protein [Clostridium butyricum]|nr:DUF3284 domain-containing protein [Clostridium butyricum]
MKMSGVVNYSVEEVFNIFTKNAKRDFKDFKEENAIGCKIVKDITTGGKNPIRCTVEITDYIKNSKYQITTSNDYSKCVSTYTFKPQINGTTLLTLHESQGNSKFLQSMTLIFQRILARQRFKAAFNNIILSLNNELKRHHENLERSTPKKEVDN